MIPILYSADETDFTTNGLGGLGDCISCQVTEERNGQYTLEMVYPINGIHFEDIAYSEIIKVVPSDGTDEQLFRIYKISKPINGKVEIEADHISYQLSYIPVSAFTASSCSAALNGLVTNSMETNPFTVWTDKTTTATYTQTLPESFRSRLGGVQGSILDVYGGEYEFDNYTVKLHASRGSDSGVTLRYGKNITDIKQEENIANTVTGICPYWTDGTTTVTGDIQYADNASAFPFKRTEVKDFSEAFEDAPTKAQLESYTQSYIDNNNIGVPAVSIEVSFVALWQTEDYADVANLERVNLCDTVTIEFEKLGISTSAKVIKTVYDVLKERYISIEIGEARTNLATTINDIQTTTKTAASDSFMRQAINHATELIRGGLGGHVVINTNADGEPNEILIMDSDDISDAVNVIRMNVNGIGFSKTGYDGEYTTAWTIDGKFNADFITTGTILGILIKGSTIQFGENNLHATMAYQESQGFGGGKAMTITGNTRVAIESTAYQCRMTGVSTHVGAIAVEGNKYVDKAYTAIFKNLDGTTYTADTTADYISGTGRTQIVQYVYGDNGYANGLDIRKGVANLTIANSEGYARGIKISSSATDISNDTQITGYVYNDQGYANGLDVKSTYAKLTAATSTGTIRGLTITADKTTISGPLKVNSPDNVSGVVGAVTDGLKLQYYGSKIYVYVNGSQVGSITLE